MPNEDVIIVGGGAAGFFAAAACGEAAPSTRILILEKSNSCLAKVRISGGGRCNVTHACFDPRVLSSYYPRGGAPLLGAFHRFQPQNTIEWFAARGVRLKKEADGRMFPVTDSSRTIVDCLFNAVRNAGAAVRTGAGVSRVEQIEPGGFKVHLQNGDIVSTGKVILTTGGCRTPAAADIAVALGHTLIAPVPSLFAFNLADTGLRQLAGVSLDSVEVSVPSRGLRDRGALLFTHTGVSGPAILKLSAWGARELHRANYNFDLKVNWLPATPESSISESLNALRKEHPARLVANTPPSRLPARLWEQLLRLTSIPRETRWAGLSRGSQHQLLQSLIGTRLQVCGKSLNRDEFVTCGGVALKEVDFKTMQSRICRGLYLAGELLDIDALTGGFNFQAAWTTGWIAGKNAAEES